MDQAKSFPNYPGVSENLADFRRNRISDKVKVLWELAGKQISDSAAHNIGLVTCRFESFDNSRGFVIDLGAIDAVLLFGIHICMRHGIAIAVSSVADEHGRDYAAGTGAYAICLENQSTISEKTSDLLVSLMLSCLPSS